MSLFFANIFLSSISLITIAGSVNQVLGDCVCHQQTSNAEAVPTRSTLFRGDILNRCNIAIGASSPFENEKLPTVVEMLFMIDRFLDVDDVAGALQMLVGLTLIWRVPCVAAVARQTGFSQSGSYITLNETHHWQPPIGNRNAVRDTMMTEHFGRVLQLQPETGTFRLTIVGVTETACAISLGDFPFDKQECSIAFSSFLNDDQIRISNTSSIVTTSDTAFSVASNWRLDGLATKLAPQMYPNRSYHEIHFNVRIHRSPRYYITAVVVNNIVLTTLICLTVLLPPDTSKRSQYSIAVNLAFVLQHAQVLEMIPHSSQQPFFATYLIIEIFYAMIVTVYSVVMACLVDSFPSQAGRIIILGKFRGKVHRITAVRFIDSIVFSFLFIIVWIIQIKPFVLLLSNIDAFND